MKKYLNLAFVYAIAAMAGWVFYREFTKWNGFAGRTALGKVHPHLFLLGTVIFLLIALFSQSMRLEEEKKFRIFMRIYNLGLPILALTLFVRGIIRVLGMDLSRSMDLALSGVAGIGHTMVGIGLVLLLMSLKKCAEE